MDFYLDENLPPRLAKALNELDEENRILHTQIEFGKGIKDVPLIDKLNEIKGIKIIVTNDKKFKQRIHQYRVYKDNNLSTIMISLPAVTNYWVIINTIVNKWELITKLSREHEHPFICKIYLRKNPQMGGEEYAFF